MVEQVKRLESELHGQPFDNGSLLLERRVHFIIPGATSNVAPKVSPREREGPCERGRYGERRWIEPVVDGSMGGVNRDTGDQVRPLIPTVAIGPVLRAHIYYDVNRTAARCRRNPTQLPAAQHLSRGTAAGQETLARAKRKLVDRIERQRLTNVNVRTAIVTSEACHVFIGRRVARSESLVSQAVRPHVLRLPRPSTGERTLQGYLKRVEVAVADVSFLAVRAKRGNWTCARQWIYEIGP